MFYVYVLRSESDSGFYIWLFNQPAHAAEAAPGRRQLCDQIARPVEADLLEAYAEREDAEGRERFLKSGAGRRFLRAQLRHYLKRFPTRTARKASGPRGRLVSTEHHE